MFATKVLSPFLINPNPVSKGGFVFTMDMVTRIFYEANTYEPYEIKCMKYFPFIRFYDVDYSSIQMYCCHVKRANVITFDCKLRLRIPDERPNFIVCDDMDDLPIDREKIEKALLAMGSSLKIFGHRKIYPANTDTEITEFIIKD